MNERVEAIRAELRAAGYIAGADLSMTVHLAIRLGRPLLLEGPAGVGKTELAKALAKSRGVELVRLQCYEGLDAAHALYDWDYPKQLLAARTALSDVPARDAADSVGPLYSERFLIERPLLRALRMNPPPVLLLDEIDRADEEFEALLLEFLSEFQITIPELGAVRSKGPLVVVLTSNRTRDLSDALRRRCLYHWLDYPTLEQEMEIVRSREPGIHETLARSIGRFARKLRQWPLQKPPGLAETLDWAAALRELGALELDSEVAAATLGCMVKTGEDMAMVRERGVEAL